LSSVGLRLQALAGVAENRGQHVDRVFVNPAFDLLPAALDPE
jgi:hypothetical protein